MVKKIIIWIFVMIVLSNLVFADQYPHNNPLSMHHYYSFNATAGSVLEDYINNSNVNLVNMVDGDWVAGIWGNALQYPNDNDYGRNMTSPAIFNGGTAYCYHVKFRVDSTGGTHTVFFMNNEGKKIALRFIDGILNVMHLVGSSYNTYSVGISANKWNNVTVTWDNQNRYIWVNGVFKDKTPLVGFDIMANDGDWIGSWSGSQSIGSGGAQTGKLEEFIWANRNCSLFDINSMQLGNYSLPPPPAYVINISTGEDQQFNTINISLNRTINTTINYNCSIYINDTLNTSIGNQLSGNNKWIKFNISGLLKGIYNYTISCYGNDSFSNNNTNTTVNLFYVDLTNPAIDDNFINKTIIYNQNLSFEANFTDDFNIYSYNISLNGTQLAYKKGINRTFYQLNFSQSINSYDTGTYILDIITYDGHTKNKIKEFDKVSNGLFNDYLRFTDNKKDVKIYAKDKSMFDTWTYRKLIDRYAFDFKPSNIKNSYTFIVETDNKLDIINNKNTKWKSWIVAGDKWIDFYLPNENNNLTIIKINDYKAEVTLTNLKNKELLRFNSIGELNKANLNYTLYKINTTEIYSLITMEQSFPNLKLNISHPSGSITSLSAKLIYNGTNYTATKISGADYTLFSADAIAPNVTINSNVSFYWEITADSYIFNTTPKNQTILNLWIGSCGPGDDILLNMTQQDENTQININTTDLQIDLTITDTSSGGIFNYHNSTNLTSIAVCLSAGTLDSMTASEYPFTIDIITGYEAASYVQEFLYLDNATIDNSSSFNSYTPHNITLFDLPITDSTTFLFTFYDEFGLSMDDIIVHTFRQYIGESVFKEVERSRQDENGETHIHLIEEDVIYYFMITQFGNIIYTSEIYNAKCISTPCQIELTASPTFTSFEWDTFDGTVYEWDENKTTRIVELGFTSNATDTINLSLYQYQNNIATLINKSSLIAENGNIPLTVPRSYGNTTFFAVVYKNDKFVESRWVDFRESARDYFGATGAILSGFLVAAIALMAASEGIILIISICIMVFFIGIMMLVDLSWLAIISIICAGGIIIYKLIQFKRGT